MLNTLRTMSARSWRMLMRWTALGTLGCVAFAVTFNFVLFRDLGGVALGRSLYSGTIIPVLLAGPLFFYLTLKLRELAIANHKLAAAASTDGLTGCLNRRAFADQVENRIAHPRSSSESGGGALLVIDADHFKHVNDRFGHGNGDEALRRIADAIRAATRGEDIVGRLGGEEFAVFMPGATDATSVAERIRSAVQAIAFMPSGTSYPLSVSVGGIAFSQPRPFAELYREADVRLYEAKRQGRNRVVFGQAGHVPAAMAMLH